jgi:alpha-tubulin suppressor-like RCC1 family protein
MIRLLLKYLSSNKADKSLVKMTGVIAAAALAIGAATVNAQGLLTDVTKVAVGQEHSCALTSAGVVKCWGRGAEGQLGNGSGSNRYIAVNVIGLSNNIVDITAGTFHSCALTAGGGVKCWGDNQYSGVLDANTSADVMEPMDVVGLGTGVIALTSGAYFNCALTTAGGVKCWGSGGAGVLGNGSTNGSLIPVDVVGLNTGVVAISAGENHACALTSQGAVKCWGSATDGKLGNGNVWPSYLTTPVNVVGLTSGVVKIEAGVRHTCAVLATGVVQCWGTNTHGQLGDNTTLNQMVPVTASVIDSPFTALVLGSNNSCILTDAGGVKCWGGNTSGIGNTPVYMAGLQTGVAMVDTKNSHFCAVVIDGGRAICWGDGGYGKLGNNLPNGSATPVNVIQATIPAAPTAVTATPYNSFAIVSFTPPVNVGNEAITSYTVISDPSAPLEDVTGIMATKRQIRGLTNGVNYTFRVVATNIAGQSQPSEPSSPIVPMSHYVPLPTGCNLTGELVEGIIFSSELGEGDCPSSTQSPSYKREFFSFNAVPGDQVAFNIQAGYGLYVDVYNPYRMPISYGGVFYGRYPSEGYITIPAGLSGAYSIGVTNSSLYTPTGPYTITLLKNSSAASSSVRVSSSSSRLSSSNSSTSSLLNSSSISSLSSSISTSTFTSTSISTSSPMSSENSSSSQDASVSSAGSSIGFSAVSSVESSVSSAVASSVVASSVVASSSVASSAVISSANSSTSSTALSSAASSRISSSISSVSSSVAVIGCGSPMSVVFGVTYAGDLGSGDCTNGLRGGSYYTDRYSFTATSGQQITISLSSTAIDSYVYLKNPSNAVVASDDDSGGGRNSRIPASGTFTIPAGASGTYVVEVTSYSTLQTGAYSLLITSSSASSSSVASSVASSTSNSSAANACNTSLLSTLNITNSGTLSATDCNAGARGAGYYTDRYTFTATTGQLVAIKVTASAFDTYLYLRNSSGTVISSNDDGGGGTNSRIPATSGSFTIPVAGTYVIEVTSYSSGITGAYSLLRTQQ